MCYLPQIVEWLLLIFAAIRITWEAFKTPSAQLAAAAAAKSLQSCPTLCDPIDSSPPGSPVPGILQARTLEWVAVSFSNAWKWKVKGKTLSHIWLLATPWTAAYQAPLSMGFSKQGYWSGVPLPSPSLLLYPCLNKRYHFSPRISHCIQTCSWSSMWIQLIQWKCYFECTNSSGKIHLWGSWR